MIIKLFATFFGAGYMPISPGTFGTVVGVLLFWATAGLPLSSYIIFVIAFIIFAVWISGQTEKLYGEKDPKRVVIDEVAGFLVTMLGQSWRWELVVVGFILFRFFDILKPFPIRKLERSLGGGWGIVLDDVAAGIYANIVLRCLGAWVLIS